MKGYTRAGEYQSKKVAQARADSIRHKFNSVIVKRGTRGEAWGNKRPCYRVWVK
tara:strand:+ start:2712 stop:2873 length:162 start_codon:yes stop_codon:yes gene_type:complete